MHSNSRYSLYWDVLNGPAVRLKARFTLTNRLMPLSLTFSMTKYCSTADIKISLDPSAEPDVLVPNLDICYVPWN